MTEIFEILLKDRTTGKNIIWANSERDTEEIQLKDIDSIRPRWEKVRAQQKQRTRDRAEIFTPPEICKLQNDLIADDKNIWKKHFDAKFLEITCGEAPYLVNRYNAVTGAPIEIQNRSGLLDRKLSVVNKEISTISDWQDWTIRAVKSVYGYDFQGDNLFLARKNIFETVKDFYREKFSAKLPKDFLREIAEIISWNIWQMDGLKNTVPYENTNPEIGLFDDEQQQKKIFFCQIMDWSTGNPFEFRKLAKGERL